MNQRWRWILGSSVLVIAVIVTTLTWKPWAGKAELLTGEAVEVALLAQYPGIVNSNVKLEDVYLMELQTDQGLYTVEVGAYSGEVVTLQQLQVFTEEDDSSVDQGSTVEPTPSSKPTPSSNPADPPEPTPSSVPNSSNGAGTGQGSSNVDGDKDNDSKPNKEAATLLTSDKAGTLAAAHIKGEVEDISLKTAKDGKKFYLVEIDVNDGRDAVVQVNAISGAIMSVVWEKDDDDSDDHD